MTDPVESLPRDAEQKPRLYWLPYSRTWSCSTSISSFAGRGRTPLEAYEDYVAKGRAHAEILASIRRTPHVVTSGGLYVGVR